MVKTEMSLTGFSFRYFDWSGKVLSKLFYPKERIKIEEKLEAAGLRIYPEAYLSLVGFITFLSIPLTAIPVLLLRLFLPTIGIMGIISWLFLILSPLTVIFLGYAIPTIMSKNRASNLDIEVPFAGAYISVMATGGVSPYLSLRRLKDFKLLPNISKASSNIEVDVKVRGLDPVTAMERSAMHLPSRDYKDLLMGYASTLRSGGDVIHYLLIRTETMFRDLATKVKAFGDRAALLMESYIAITILTTLSLSIIYMTSIAFESFWQGFFTVEGFLLYAYFLVPSISILFIYLADASQIHRPVNEWGPYKVFLATSPLTILLLLTMFIPFATGFALPFTKPIADFIVLFRSALGLERGYEAAIGLSLTLIASAIPAAVAHNYYTKRGKGVEHDVTNFLRDLTEARKTGATPERCIQNLSGRNYGRLTKHLKVTSRQIGWGLPFQVIYETFRTKIKSWLALINISLLVDAIEVGGGTPETLETLTRFSEMLSSLEKEKRATLRPLLIMPYIGAGILLFSTIVFLQFMRFVLQSFSRQAMPFAQFVTLLLPPLILQAYLTGLVTGKISSETLSTGFKHAAILVAMAIVLMLLSSSFAIPFQWG